MYKNIMTNITNIGDPFIVLENGKYYLFATTPNETCGFYVWASNDLQNFKLVGLALSSMDSFGKSEFWAPEVYKYQNKYYMFYSARGNDGIMHVQVAISDEITGPYKDYDNLNPLVNFGNHSTIDAHVFFDDDNKKYLFYSLDCSTNVVDGVHTSQIYCMELDDSLTKAISSPVFISTPNREWEFKSGPSWRWNEGPTVLKHNNRYYLTYSTNYYASKEYSVGCYVSDNVLGPYVKMIDEPILSYIDGIMSGPGHNSFFVDKNGQLKCVYHIHTDYNNPSGDRRAVISNAYFDDNGLLKIDYK